MYYQIEIQLEFDNNQKEDWRSRVKYELGVVKIMKDELPSFVHLDTTTSPGMKIMTLTYIMMLKDEPRRNPYMEKRIRQTLESIDKYLASVLVRHTTGAVYCIDVKEAR